MHSVERDWDKSFKEFYKFEKNLGVDLEKNGFTFEYKTKKVLVLSIFLDSGLNLKMTRMIKIYRGVLLAIKT